MASPETCWALDMLAAPRRERWAWVSARCALLESHLAELRVELQAAVDGKRPAGPAQKRIEHLRSALDLIDRKLAALDEAGACPTLPRPQPAPAPG